MAETKPAFELVVTEAFGAYAKGDIISDAKKIAELVGGEFENHFVKKSVS